MKELLSCKLYCQRQSSRLDYVVELMQLCWPDVTIDLVDRPAEPSQNSLLISYGTLEKGHVFIPDAGLLWETGVDERSSPLAPWPDDSTTITFDILSSIFYVATRYEEYSRTDKDLHGRNTGVGSDLDLINLLDKPAVPYWLGRLTELHGFKIPRAPFKKILSCDIDQAYKFKYRGGLRSLVGLIKTDLYNTYELLHNKSSGYQYDMHYFIPAAQVQTRYDEAQSPAEPYMKALGDNLAEHATIGWHPGYYTADNYDLLRREKELLEQSWKRRITHSRMHYLRLFWPTTYRLLNKLGIKHEHSMGYADRVGWRSGMHLEYPWYDAEMDKRTQMLIHPLILMDVTVKNYLQEIQSDIPLFLSSIKQQMYKYGGDWSVLWHNTSFDPQEGWPRDSLWLDQFLDI